MLGLLLYLLNGLVILGYCAACALLGCETRFPATALQLDMPEHRLQLVLYPCKGAMHLLNMAEPAGTPCYTVLIQQYWC